MHYFKRILGGFGCILIFLALIVSACNKETQTSAVNNIRHVSVYVTANASLYTAVFMDIQKVEVATDTSSAFSNKNSNHSDTLWNTLAMSPGVYNISSLKNGLDTLLASGNITGKLKSIRLTLGNRNTVLYKGNRYPLQLQTGSKAITVQVGPEQQDGAGTNQIETWMNFEVSKSIIPDGERFYLKPVFKPFNLTNFGSLEGRVEPADAIKAVIVYNEQDTTTVVPDKSGAFILHGLRAGTYQVTYKALTSNKDITLTNIQVQNGRKTNIASVPLNLK
jgi:hypothetical protein